MKKLILLLLVLPLNFLYLFCFILSYEAVLKNMKDTLQMSCQKIISGGQTGIDRGALDAALHMNFPCGGWCPEGRIAEDGKIHKKYPLQELKGGGNDERTKKNVEDSDGTLLIFRGKLEGGSLLTYRHAKSTGKAVFLLKISEPKNFGEIPAILSELEKKEIKTLNIAGPRASEWKDAYQTSLKITFHLIQNFR